MGKKKEEKIEELKSVIEEIDVKVKGIVPIMFDRFTDMEGNHPPDQKMYLDQNNGLVFPAVNVHSFFFGREKSCAARFTGKKSKTYIDLGYSYVAIKPALIPITRNGSQIIFNGFDKKERDNKADIWVQHDKAIVKSSKGLAVPSPKQRPVVNIPWEMAFVIKIVKNDTITSILIYNWLVKGGFEVSFGTFRPFYGKFVVVDK